VSFVVDPDGRVRAATAVFRPAAPVEEVRLGRGGTFYTRHGDWLPLCEMWLCMALLAWSALSARLTRGARG
jgi:apolipoprotein N-acyltransferase